MESQQEQQMHQEQDLSLMLPASFSPHQHQVDHNNQEVQEGEHFVLHQHHSSLAQNQQPYQRPGHQSYLPSLQEQTSNHFNLHQHLLLSSSEVPSSNSSTTTAVTTTYSSFSTPV